jgi:hypothetical protein
LPAEPYEYAEWRVRRVGLDYHVDIDGHYYSVPHRLIREQLDARITAHTIELFRKGERVAVHLRGAGRGSAYDNRRVVDRPSGAGSRLTAGRQSSRGYESASNYDPHPDSALSDCNNSEIGESRRI